MRYDRTSRIRPTHSSNHCALGYSTSSASVELVAVCVALRFMGFWFWLRMRSANAAFYAHGGNVNAPSIPTTLLSCWRWTEGKEINENNKTWAVYESNIIGRRNSKQNEKNGDSNRCAVFMTKIRTVNAVIVSEALNGTTQFRSENLTYLAIRSTGGASHHVTNFELGSCASLYNRTHREIVVTGGVLSAFCITLPIRITGPHEYQHRNASRIVPYIHVRFKLSYTHTHKEKESKAE